MKCKIKFWGSVKNKKNVCSILWVFWSNRTTNAKCSRMTRITKTIFCLKTQSILKVEALRVIERCHKPAGQWQIMPNDTLMISHDNSWQFHCKYDILSSLIYNVSNMFSQHFSFLSKILKMPHTKIMKCRIFKLRKSHVLLIAEFEEHKWLRQTLIITKIIYRNNLFSRKNWKQYLILNFVFLNYCTWLKKPN